MDVPDDRSDQFDTDLPSDTGIFSRPTYRSMEMFQDEQTRTTKSNSNDAERCIQQSCSFLILVGFVEKQKD